MATKTTLLSSNTATGIIGNSISNQAALSQDGRYGVFASDAQSLSTKAFGQNLIYDKDMQTGALAIISATAKDIAANSNSSQADISGDGHFVSFQSYADNLIADDGNNDSDVFLKDTSTKALTLISGVGAQVGDGWSGNADMTADGRYVVFESQATNFIDGDNNGASDIYLRDIASGTLSLVSHPADTSEADYDSMNPVISDNGRYVAFASDATNLVANDSNDSRDIFVKDLQSGAMTLISNNDSGLPANGESDNPSISQDGAKIVFSSYATDLVSDANLEGYAVIYVYKQGAAIELVSDGIGGQAVDGNSWDATISPDGKSVAFVSDATNLVESDSNNLADIFVANLDTGKIERLGDNSNLGDSENPAFSGDSLTIAFSRWNGDATDPSNTENVYVTANPFAPHINSLPTGSVTFTGIANQGKVLTAANTLADVDGLSTIAYQWLRGGSVIAGAISTSYKLAQADVGKTISVKASYTDGFGTPESAVSKPTTPVISTQPSSGNDILTGTAGNDFINGLAGADTMMGRLGNDTYVVDNTGDVVTETSTQLTEIDKVNSSIDYTLGSNLENLTLTGTSAINGTGNKLNNVLTGNTAANTLKGFDGNDIINGLVGADTMRGGLGNDTYVVDNTGDVVTETSTLPTEIDKVNSSINYTLGPNLENLALTGMAPINGTGNTLNNALTGNTGANTLNGGVGVDKLVGGLGNDVYVVDNTGDVVTETSTLPTEIDKVNSSINYTLGPNLENLALTGTAPINGSGNTLNNVLTGNAGANTLKGGSGNDILNGGLGQDNLTGGAGADKFKFNIEAETGVTGANRDTITDFKHSEVDKVDLSAIDANTTFAGNNAFSAPTVGGIFSGIFANRGDLYFDKTTAILYGNNDTDSSADFSIHLTGVSTLSAADLCFKLKNLD